MLFQRDDLDALHLTMRSDRSPFDFGASLVVKDVHTRQQDRDCFLVSKGAIEILLAWMVQWVGGVGWRGQEGGRKGARSNDGASPEIILTKKEDRAGCEKVINT